MGTALAEVGRAPPHHVHVPGPAHPPSATHSGRPRFCSRGPSPWLHIRSIRATPQSCRCPGSPRDSDSVDSNSDSLVWLSPHLMFAEPETQRGQEICLRKYRFKTTTQKNIACFQNVSRDVIIHSETVNLGPNGS